MAKFRKLKSTYIATHSLYLLIAVLFIVRSNRKYQWSIFINNNKRCLVETWKQSPTPTKITNQIRLKFAIQLYHIHATL